MAGTVIISDMGSTIRISDGNVQRDIYKSKCTVSYTGDYVTIEDDIDLENSYVQPSEMFASPSGDAPTVQAAIAAMLYIHT